MLRTLKQSLANAKRIEDELPHLSQPSSEDYDMINMRIHIDNMESKIIDMQMLIIDLHATLRTCANSSNSMIKTCEEERNRLVI